MRDSQAHGHGHKTGVSRSDLIITVSDVFISVMSLVVSINHDHAMEKLAQENERMAAANTTPCADGADGARKRGAVGADANADPSIREAMSIQASG